MKQIIDNDTGEVIEVEETNEVMVRELYELGTDLEKYAELEEQALYIQEQLEIWKYENRENIKNVLKAHKKKNITTPTRIFTLIEEGMRKSVDTERLKEDGMYDRYVKFTPTKESLRITKRKD